MKTDNSDWYIYKSFLKNICVYSFDLKDDICLKAFFRFVFVNHKKYVCLEKCKCFKYIKEHRLTKEIVISLKPKNKVLQHELKRVWKGIVQ